MITALEMRGKVIIDYGGGELDLAIDVNGKLVVTVENTLLRLNADGSPDTSFGSDGSVTTDFNVTALELDHDNKIVVAGEGRRGEGNFFAARYNTDGSLDTSFGEDGVATTDFGGDDDAYALVIDETGRLVVGGYTTNNVDLALARYNADGSLDTSFGEGGKVTTNVSPYGVIHALTFDEDDNLLAAGYYNGDFGLVRYKPDGSLDTSFGTKGVITGIFSAERGGTARALALTQDNKIVMAGYKGSTTGIGQNFVVVQIEPQ